MTTSFNKNGFLRSDIFVRVSKKVELKLIKFNTSKTHLPPVLVFPGWITLLEKYMPIMRGLVYSGHTVYYIETREKKSSKFIPPDHSSDDFHFNCYNQDIKQILVALGLVGKKFYFLAGSFGAGLVTKYLAAIHESKYHPKSVVMIIPATNLYFIGWQKLLIRTPLILEKLIIKVVEWYIRNNFHNPKEPELAYQFQAQIFEFDFKKVQNSAIAIDSVNGMRFKKDLPKIKNEILVVGANNDLMHKEVETRNFAKLLKNSTYLNLHSNHYTHSSLLGAIASRYFQDKSYIELIPDQFE